MLTAIIGYSRDPITVSILRKMGFKAFTCDILPADHPHHIQGDIWDVADSRPWTFGVFHPMCSYLTVSAAWAFADGPYHQRVKPGTLVGADRRAAREDALQNFRRLLDLPYPVAIENPAPSFVSKAIRPPDQTIQPFTFGDDASKRTGLWLKGLPKLKPTSRFTGRMVEWPRGAGKTVERFSNQTDSGQNKLSPSDNRWLERSKTFPGIAKAFAHQWGEYIIGTAKS